MLVQDFLEEYFLTSNLRDSTAEQYQNSVNLIEKWHGSPLHLEEMTDLFISRWIKDYESDKSPHTVRTRRSALIAIMKGAYQSRHVEYEPKRIRPVKGIQTTPKDVWNALEIQALIAKTPQVLKGRFRTTNIQKALYFSSLITMAFESGLRLGDILAIKSEDLLTKDIIEIETQKTGRPVQVVISDNLKNLIFSTYEGFNRDRSLVWPAYRSGSSKNQKRGMQEQARKIMIACNLRCSDGVFKKLRRSSITEAERLQPGTGWIQGGHSKPDVTIKHYLNQDMAYKERQRPRLSS